MEGKWYTDTPDVSWMWPENWNYILEFMDHTEDREEGDADHRG